MRLFPLLSAILLLSVSSAPVLEGQSRRSGVSFTGDRAPAIESKRVPIQESNLGSRSSGLQGQRFDGMREYRAEFSPLGQRRSNVGQRESRLQNQRFEANRVDMPEVAYGMARQNERMAELRDRAQIDTTDRAWFMERSPRAMIDLQNVQHFTDQVKEADLRDINRFQFRRNRPDGIPVQPAGR